MCGWVVEMVDRLKGQENSTLAATLQMLSPWLPYAGNLTSDLSEGCWVTPAVCTESPAGDKRLEKTSGSCSVCLCVCSCGCLYCMQIVSIIEKQYAKCKWGKYVLRHGLDLLLFGGIFILFALDNVGFHHCISFRRKCFAVVLDWNHLLSNEIHF